MPYVKRFYLYIILGGLSLLFTGCANHSTDEGARRVAYKAQIAAVQDAIDSYKKKTGVLPIKNSTESTPIYRKYRIDFNKLKAYLPNPPSDAYEEGGDFEYVLVDPETHPTVKVIDMELVSEVQDLNQQIQIYYAHHKFAPLKDILADGRYSIDFKALGYKNAPTVISPYSGRHLSFFLDEHAKVEIDYLPDIEDVVKKSGKTYKEGVDLRALLVDKYPYVPIYSVPYTMKKGQVEFLIEDKKK
ncbi:hypothetical protein GCM10011391_16870 [Pullulanibacillus camelliae]|uniref:Lipoprotein n=1 Tax=Pullulanibacillus camelliae TaxID=1707096 RepID=A0A8J2VRB6_9BACL|nr:hypothetical protein [Pullulanibacillus camelliae]GGE38690.1 hypothetical protein GCM10011391_16870 [Pullulanibacillus camelliae]